MRQHAVPLPLATKVDGKGTIVDVSTVIAFGGFPDVIESLVGTSHKKIRDRGCLDHFRAIWSNSCLGSVEERFRSGLLR